MAGDFQTFTNVLQAPGLAGDFASANPRATLLSSQVYGNTGFVAGASGLTIGLFAWLDKSTYRIASNSGSGAPDAFVHRAQEGLITTYLSSYGMTIPAGMMVGNLFGAGDFFVVNNGTTEATPGMKAYANNTTGVATFALTGAPTTGGSGTTSTIAAGTGSSAASTIVDNVFTTGGSVTGTMAVGAILTGTGVATGTQITGQLTGTAGGVGTYTVSPRDQTVASTTISATFGTLTIGGTVVSGVAVGQSVVSASTAAGTVVTALGTGTGGAGTYIVNLTQTVASEAIHTTTNTETGWYCRSFGQPGDVVKISSRTMG